MTVQEIVDRIKLEYPRVTAICTDSEIVDVLNTQQDSVFDDLQVVGTYDFITVDGKGRYALPADMQIQFIKSVLLSTDADTTVQSGTVSATAGAATLLGSGTSFTSALVDRKIVVNGELKTVESVESTTSLTVSDNFDATASGVAWYLYATPTEDGVRFNELCYAEYQDVLTRNIANGWFRFSDGTTDYIGFYPTPSVTGKTVRVVYRPTPTELSASVMTATPDLFYRWHILLVYGAVSDIAGMGSNPDSAIANNYARKYNTELEKARQNRFERDRPGYASTKNVAYKNWNYARNVLSGRRKSFSNYSYEDM